MRRTDRTATQLHLQLKSTESKSIKLHKTMAHFIRGGTGGSVVPTVVRAKKENEQTLVQRLTTHDGRFDSAVHGAFAGLVATLPMSAVMLAVQRVLPRSSQIPLEPEIITDKMLQRANIHQEISERGRNLAALVGHFAYGAACGAVCATVAGRRLQSSPSTGLMSGLFVWMASYAGWLPVAKILPPPPQRLPGRNVLLLAAHSAWGLSLHAVLRRTRRAY